MRYGPNCRPVRSSIYVPTPLRSIANDQAQHHAGRGQSTATGSPAAVVRAAQPLLRWRSNPEGLGDCGEHRLVFVPRDGVHPKRQHPHGVWLEDDVLHLLNREGAHL